MSTLSSLSKSKYTANLNIFSLKSKENNSGKTNSNLAGKKQDSTHLKCATGVIQSKENRESKDSKDSHTNSFRQTGSVNLKKFKTTKCSPEKFFVDRNTSEEKKENNFIKNSITSSLGSKHGVNLGSTINNVNKSNYNPNSEGSELGIDIIKGRLKNSISKSKVGGNSGILNNTNPGNVANTSNSSNSVMKNLISGKMNPVYPKEGSKFKMANVNVSQSLTEKEEKNQNKKHEEPINHVENKPTKLNDLHTKSINTISSINKLSTSLKKIPSKNPKMNNLTNPINMSKIINKITSNTESMLKDLKKGSQPKAFGEIKDGNKISMTTPATKKNSRKNSSEKDKVTIVADCDNKPILNSYVNFNNNNKSTNPSGKNTSSSHFKQNIKLSSGINSNYMTNNSNLSNNNSGIHSTNNSNLKGLTNVNYEEINLVSEESKKSGKTDVYFANNITTNNQSINTNNSSHLTNLNNFNNLNNKQQSNLEGNSALPKSGAFSNLQLFDLKNNFVKNPSAYLKKKNNFGISMPVTNKSSKTGSKSNSKSVSRIDEKIERSEKHEKVEHSNNNIVYTSKPTSPNPLLVNNPNQTNSNANANNNVMTKNKINLTNPNYNPSLQCSTTSTSKSKGSFPKTVGLNIASSLPSNDKIPQNLPITKKHLTSKNSPTHFPFNFNKDSLAGNKKDPPMKNKPVVSLVEKNVKYLQSLKSSQEKSLIKHDKTAIADLSMESVLNNSTSSVKSTIREAKYYKKEAERISQFIKGYFTANGDYPVTSLKFYKFGRLLGRGAFGKVNLCLHTGSGRLVAVKSFNKSRLMSESAKRKIYHEVNLMKNLKHNSIVKIFEIIESPRYILLVLDYVCGGDLLSFVRKRTKLNEVTAKFIFRQIIEALRYIHSQNIIHRDIKLDNILIDLNNTIKICDFGVGRQVNPGDTMHDQCGTPAYIAPEILLNQGYEGFGVDVWSAGVVLYAMLSGTVPFKANNMTDLHRLILGGSFNPIKDISEEAADLIKGILEVDPKSRLTLEQILSHEWLRSTDELFNGKTKSNKLNLFANAERTILSKSNIDYRNASKDDIIELFTLKNLDTNQESENQNVGSKSFILAPFNSSIKQSEFCQTVLQIENEAIKFIGKAKEANRNYELNNNGEIDNGILINPVANIPNVSLEEEEFNYDANKSPNAASREYSKAVTKQTSKLTSPPEYKDDANVKEDSHRNSRKNVKDLSMTNATTFMIDENVVKMCESIGYKKDYLMKCLYYNELNYATTAYYLFLNSTMD